MSNPVYTRRANLVISLVKSDGVPWNGVTNDPHPPFGNEEGSTRIARIEVRFPEPDWPHSTNTGLPAGTLVHARLKMHERGGVHLGYKGANPRLSVERINETPDRNNPSSTGGDPKVWSLDGAEVHDVTAMVEEMLPTRIRRQSDPERGCGNRPYGMFQIKSVDETDDQRSGVLDDAFYLSVEIKTAVTPDTPVIRSITGAQVDERGEVSPTDPVIVASDSGGVLEVVFAYVGEFGDTASKAEMELRSVGATDGPPPLGTIIKATGSVTPTKTGVTDEYRIRMTGVPPGTEGVFHIRATSQRGVTGPWSSFEDELAHVQLVNEPGAPLDIVFQPYTEDAHVLFSLNSPEAADYLTGAEAEGSLLPQGTPAFATGMTDVASPVRRADLDLNTSFADGQLVSFRVRTKNSHGVIGKWSALRTVVVRAASAPVITPAPGRLATQEPTFTITDATFDGYRLRLLDPEDDAVVIYDTGGQTVTDETSFDVVVPPGKLVWGQAFRVVASTLPDGSATYGAETAPQPYTIARLATATVSVPDAIDRNVATTTPEFLRTVTDPDGAAIDNIEQEVRVAATPQGSGSLVVDDVDVTATALYTVPGASIPFETAVDTRVRAENDTGEYGPWSRWLTITALEPPDADLISPDVFVTINDPTPDLIWSFTGHGGRTQASAVAGFYTEAGDLIGSVAVDGPDNTAQVPAYLLDDATNYLWDVTLTDSEGMSTTSSQRSFTTAFTDPIPVDSVSVVADPQSGAVDISWGTIEEHYPHNIEVTWLADDGSPVRIDGGPESLGDGNEPFVGGSIRHIGARLGLNVYHVAISNGNKASEPVTGEDTLRVPEPAFPFLMVDGTGVVGFLPVTGASQSRSAIIERMQPPGGAPRQVTWGEGPRTWSLNIQSLDEDPDLKSGLTAWMRAGAGLWVKAPAGYHIEPTWSAIQSLSPTPGTFGIVDTSLDTAELGDPVHAILPVADEVLEDEGNIYTTVDALDFGTFEET